ncbi:GNAT family N-acetyltransferase [Maricurvus nonylphenolicus]|uniref:GNAT family N-acetyltransferase n=1 Tax=Maricurvus nonylphenolicus TaxID=1008307 RepID=UPI0036F205F2
MLENTDMEYKVNAAVSLADFKQLLINSTLGDRRPIDDDDCLQGMLANSNLMVSAWDNGQLVGIARSVTDFHYACYLSDLAVSASYQKLGIGKQLLRLTQDQLKPQCKLILLAAPAANEYYEPIGFSHNPRCWVLERDQSIR